MYDCYHAFGHAYSYGDWEKVRLVLGDNLRWEKKEYWLKKTISVFRKKYLLKRELKKLEKKKLILHPKCSSCMQKQSPIENEKVFLFILALTQFTHILDFMIIMPLGKQIMDIFQISPLQFGSIVSAYALGSFLSSFFAAGYIDQYDRKTALLFLCIGFTIGTFSCAVAPNYLFFLGARALTGAFGGVISALVFSIIGDVIPLARRGKAMGLVLTAFSVASIAGVPAGVLLASKMGWQFPFVILGILAVMIVFVVIKFIPPITGHIKEGVFKSTNPIKTIQQIIEDKNQLWALLFTVVLMLGHFTIIPFIAPFLQANIGFSNEEVSYVYFFGGILSAILLPIYGTLTDKYGALNVFYVASVAALFSIFAITNMPLVTVPIALLITSSFFIASSGRSVPSNTMVTSVVQAETRGSFMSVRSSFREAGLFLGSLLAGAIIVENEDGSLGNFEVVGYITMVMSVLAVFVARKIRMVG